MQGRPMQGRPMKGLGAQNRQPHSPLKCKVSMMSSWLPRGELSLSALHVQEGNASASRSSSMLDRPERASSSTKPRPPPRASSKGLPALGSKPQTQRMVASPSRGLPLARRTWTTGDSLRQTWSTGFLDRGHPSGPAAGNDVLGKTCGTWSAGYAADRSTGYSPDLSLLGLSAERSPANGADSRRPSLTTGEQHQTIDHMAHQTWSGGFLPRAEPSPCGGGSADRLRWTLGCGQGNAGKIAGWKATGKTAGWKQMRVSFQDNTVDGFESLGLPLWESLLQALMLQDAGPLAAVSKLCLSHLKRDLFLASQKNRICSLCKDTFSYRTGWEDCRYHPGKEQVNCVGDSPALGMMDVAWTCCGKGATYTVGMGLPCTKCEVDGCCIRNHRAKRGRLRQAWLS